MQSASRVSGIGARGKKGGFVKSLTRQLVSLAMAVGMVPGLVSCTDEEIAATAGAIAIGAAVVAIGASSPTYVCESGYDYVCTNHVDYRGRMRRDCRHVYDSCHRRVYVHSFVNLNVQQEIESKPFSETRTIDTGLLSDVNFAKTFGLGFNASAKFLNAMNGAKNGNAKALTAIGLEKSDLKSMSKYELPSQKSIQKMAQALDQQPKAVEDMLSHLLSTAKAQKETQK